jgi:thiamine-phosphate pyrophosphorylase
MTHECRLYLITPPVIDDVDAYALQLEQALQGGDVACLQIRLKDKNDIPASDAHLKAVAQGVIPIAQDMGVAVLLNDRPDLVQELGADGVHIGQEDMPYAQARQMLGPDAIIGVTCHDSRHLAMEAAEAGADYVAFGAFFATDTKNPKATASFDTLEWWQKFIEVPCVAIGGITVDTAEAVFKAGADFIAVSSGVWAHPEGPETAVRDFMTKLRG